MERDILISYAKGLIEFAIEKNSLEEITSDFLKIRNIFDTKEKLLKLLDSPLISIDQKNEIIDEVFIGFNKDLINFLKIIIKSDLIKYIHRLYREYKHLYNNKLGISEGILYVPFDLEEKKIFEIRTLFEKKLNKKIDLKVIKDKKLLAGLRIIIDDTIYDYSLKTKLDDIKSNLLFKNN